MASSRKTESGVTKGIYFSSLLICRWKNAQDDVTYKPELWTVDFDLQDVTDQGIHVMVDINTGKVLSSYEDQA